MSEATTNAINVRRGSGAEEVVVLSFGMTAANEFAVSIDDGAPEHIVDAEDFTDWPSERGLGVTLIRGLADDVEFRRDVGNVVHMRFAVDDDVLEQSNGGVPA